MSVFQGFVFLAVLGLAVSSLVDEEELKSAARDFYMQKLQATSEVLKDLTATKFVFPWMMGLRMYQGHISGISDKNVDKLQIYKTAGNYRVEFHITINNLGCSYGIYQQRPHRGSSPCSGSWGMEGIRNDVHVTLTLQNHRWSPDHYECRVSLDDVRVAVDFVSLDKGSQCSCCDKYNHSVKALMEKELNDVIVEYLYHYFKRIHNWKDSDIIKANCMI